MLPILGSNPGRVCAYVVSASSFSSNLDSARSLLLSLHFYIMAGDDDQVFNANIAQHVAEYAAAIDASVQEGIATPHAELPLLPSVASQVPRSSFAAYSPAAPFLRLHLHHSIKLQRNQVRVRNPHVPSNFLSNGIRAFRHYRPPLICRD